MRRIDRHLNPMPMATIADRCADIARITDEPIVSVAGGKLTIDRDRLPDNPMSFADGEHLASEILRAIGKT
jgi:hypothetical protein